MKKSIAHLPKRRQDDIYFLVTQVLKKLPQTTMIILYGSYARGNFVEYDERVKFGIHTTYMSDYDILVVTEGIGGRNTEHILDNIDDRYYNDLEYQTPVQFIHDDIEKLNSDLSEGRYFYTEIKRDGIMLYNSGKHKLARRRKLRYDEIKQQAEMYFEEKLSRANSFFKGVGFYYDDHDFRMCSFHLHQTCENLFYAVCLTFTLKNNKLHNLAKLLREVRKYSSGFDNIFLNQTTEEKRLFKLVKVAYVEARYNPKFVVTKEDIDALMPIVGRLLELGKSICEEKIKEYERLGKEAFLSRQQK